MKHRFYDYPLRPEFGRLSTFLVIRTSSFQGLVVLNSNGLHPDNYLAKTLLCDIIGICELSRKVIKSIKDQ